MKKLGRNESCHCGSGKKYKKCCLPQENTKKQENKEFFNQAFKLPEPKKNQNFSCKTLPTIPMSEELNLIFDKCINHVIETDKAFFKKAKKDMSTLFRHRMAFDGYSENKINKFIDALDENYTKIWAVSKWIPDLLDQMEIDEHNISEKQLIRKLANQDGFFNEDEKQTALLISNAAFSYYLVEEVLENNNQILLKDLLFGNKFNVTNDLLPKNLVKGEIIFAQFILLKNQYHLFGIWPHIIKNNHLDKIEEYRLKCIYKYTKDQKITTDLFRTRFEMDLRDILSIVMSDYNFRSEKLLYENSCH
ncbi:SEC-C domain-containing protein [Thiotrichales bacterium 19X7-9]|nr:SEC-C domain-containing protein [Thiotrichales bacterium 19X7-9]